MTYQVNCSRNDGFVIESNDEDEVVSIVQRHAREKHDMEMSDDDVRDVMEQT